ncbi:major facilitator superfamily domain-containing protein 8 [Bradysia coprophila]|uniref:major facilitator superfamily domain-containing protein 8 n=1 Tax=Bradysia coprophila TaxID=38358 RepID=UPI00187D95BE|nr:major facilitator superfamily domain-containing protein 8 [Bradysia coprophila]XP_037047468.1 major facilitator superfamily domain-containing protein 8 [Bradysia coprophila]XP_037047477.1 major facilitator superfamily domain-containing protein 8 [Bradysia coprophila]
MDSIRKFFKKHKKITNIPDDGLETEAEYSARWLSIRIIYFTMFLMSLGFSVVLTGVWPFLDKLDPNAGKEFMGLVVASNPFGQMLFSPLFGWWGNKIKSVRIPLFCSIAIFCVASAMYSTLEYFPSATVKYWMLLSRFLVGVGSANITLCRSYLSDSTRLAERTGAVSMVSLAQVLGFIVGPALQAVVTPLGDKGVSFLPGLNMYTAAGWLNVFMAIGNFCLFLPIYFKEKRIAAKEIMKLQGKQTEKETWKGIKPDYFSCWTLIVAFFVLVFNFVLLETIGTSLTMDQFAWTKTEALRNMGILMSVGAVIACVTFVAIDPLCKRFDERSVLLWGGFFLMAIGRLVYIPYGDHLPQMATNSSFVVDNITNATETIGCPLSQEWCLTTPALTMVQFLVGYFLTCIGYPIGVTLIQTIFSKILGPRPQGVWMGMITGSGCFSRIMGPVCVGYVYTRHGTYATFGFTTVMMIVALLWLLIFRDKLLVPEVEKQKRTDVEMDDLTEESVGLTNDNKNNAIVASK